jgi:hypothetical protein
MSCHRAILLSAALLLVSCTGRVATEPKSSSIAALRSDGRLAELWWEGSDGEVVVNKEHAVTAARAGIPATTAAEASLVLLSVRGSDDGVLTLDQRKVWLVIFHDAAFEAGDACACEGSPRRPGTLVAIDAADGSVLASFGIS